MEVNKIINGDCLQELKHLSDNIVDLIVTDPPYGLAFMGHEWDDFRKRNGIVEDKPNINYQKWVVEWASECLRVLKPGAFLFYCMSPRQDLLSRAIIGLEDAGFEVGYTSMYWAYASGFPKAMNISKKVDNKLGKERPVVGVSKSAGMNNLSKLHSENDRPYTNGIPNQEKEHPITISASEEAKELEGSYAGFQPKPAVEVIIVAMKPLSEKSYLEQALKRVKEKEKILNDIIDIVEKQYGEKIIWD